VALSGTLDDLSFAEIVQVINQGRKSGELRIGRTQEQAQISFYGGEITQALLKLQAPMVPIEGAEVIYRLLGWKEGDFYFQRDNRKRARMIQETTDELILEGMKRLDEWENVTSEINDASVILRVKAGNLAERYEDLSDDARTVLRLVDAKRDISGIIRESGFDPSRAWQAITDLMTHEVVEKWQHSTSTEKVISIS